MGIAALRCLREPPVRREHIAVLAGSSVSARRLVMLTGLRDRYQARSLSALLLQRWTEA